jgi:hypothetical protein
MNDAKQTMVQPAGHQNETEVEDTLSLSWNDIEIQMTQACESQ